MNKRDVGKLLRAALAAMNNEGAHWTKAALQRRKGKELSFCPIGAINYVSGKSNRANAGYKITDENRPALYALANQIRADQGVQPISDGDDHIVTATIWQWNDDYSTAWRHIVETFRRAARDPVFPR